MGISIAILSALFMAGMQILLRKSYKEIHPSIAFLMDASLGVVLFIPLGLIFGGTFSDVPQCLIYAFIAALFSEVMMFHVLAKGDLGLISILISTYPAYTLMFAYIINNEILQPLQVFFIIITILGSVLSCIEKGIQNVKVVKDNTILPILIAMGIGISDTLSKKNINDTSAFSFLIAMALVQLPMALIFFLKSNQSFEKIKDERKNNRKEYNYSILGALFNVLSTACLYISFNYAPVSIVSPVTIIYTPIVLLYSILFLGEKINFIRFVGLVVTFTGVLGIVLIG